MLENCDEAKQIWHGAGHDVKPKQSMLDPTQKGTASLKTINEEIAQFALENSARDACLIQAVSSERMRKGNSTDSQLP